MKLKDNINKARGNTSSLLLPPHKPIKEAVNQKLLLTLHRQYAQNFLKLSKINLGFIIGNHNKLPACCWRAPSFIIISHSQRKRDPTHVRSMQSPLCFSRVSAADYCILVQLPTAPWDFLPFHRHVYCHPRVLNTASLILYQWSCLSVYS